MKSVAYIHFFVQVLYLPDHGATDLSIISFAINFFAFSISFSFLLYPLLLVRRSFVTNVVIFHPYITCESPF